MSRTKIRRNRQHIVQPRHSWQRDFLWMCVFVGIGTMVALALIVLAILYIHVVGACLSGLTSACR